MMDVLAEEGLMFKDFFQKASFEISTCSAQKGVGMEGLALVQGILMK